MEITVSTSVQSSLENAWKHWTDPASIVKWNHASDDWHTTKAENDLRVGGWFFSRMEAKDGSFGFDFRGKYVEVIPLERIVYKLEDDRMVCITFHLENDAVVVTETFDTEDVNTAERQRFGWQAILDNYKALVEAG